jgi:predicted Zn-dependent protease with MMP-like domain/predicted Zn-dependent protease
LDPLTAHLERGWDLFGQGDLAGATRSAQELLKLDPGSPEGETLLGAIASAQGDTEAAALHLEKAMELDPEFIEPLLYAIELHLFQLDDPETALRLSEQALGVAEEEDEYVEALLLQADAHVALGDADAARECLADLPPVDLGEPSFHLRAGQLLLDLNEPDRAEKHLRAAASDELLAADAYHALGLLAEDQGDRAAMIDCFRKVHELDRKGPRPSWALSEDAFEKVAEEALTELSPAIRARLANTPILARDFPPAEMVSEGFDPRLLGFFSGVPYPDKQNVGGGGHLDCILLFQRNLERACRTDEELKEEIRITLLHETGHFFGLDEDELHDLGLG